VTKLHRATLPLLAAVLLVAACDNDYGCFASIQAEIEQKGTETFRRASVSRVLRFNDRYYAATAKLSSRPAAGDEWKVASVQGSSDYSLLSVANDDDADAALYVSIVDSSGANKVYSYDGTTWTSLNTAAIPGSAWIDGLFVANGTLFAQSHDNYANSSADTYSLFYLSGAALTPVDSSVATTDNPFIGVEGDGANLWIATTSVLYSGSAPDSAFTDATGTSGLGSLSTSITSLHYGTFDAALYSGTASGHLVRCTGTVASQDLGSSPITAIADTGTTTLFAGFGITSSATTGGYYEGAFGSLASGADGSLKEQYPTTVAGRAVLDFFWDSTAGEERFFVCVAPGSDSTGYGLYSTTLAAAAWVAE
jgi:hypothetical protein